MNEKHPKTFKEMQISDDSRKNIIDALKEEGFTLEQIDAMEPERVWKLYLDTVGEIFSHELSGIAKVFRENPQVASNALPQLRQLRQELEKFADSLEGELDKKKKEGKSHE